MPEHLPLRGPSDPATFAVTLADLMALPVAPSRLDYERARHQQSSRDGQDWVHDPRMIDLSGCCRHQR